MFTLEEIDHLHARLGGARTFWEYVRALRELGVERYDTHVADGHSEYFAEGGGSVVSPAEHEVLAISEYADLEGFLEHLRRHEGGETTYLEMSRGLAECGIEKWTVDTEKMTMTFFDRGGHGMLMERIS